MRFNADIVFFSVRIRRAGRKEKMVAQAIEEDAGLWIYRFFLGESDRPAFRAPADGAGVVEEGGGAAATWYDEILERREWAFEGGDPLVDEDDILRINALDGQSCGSRKIRSEAEQDVLERAEMVAESGGEVFFRKRNADNGIELVHGAVRVKAGRGFRNA